MHMKKLRPYSHIFFWHLFGVVVAVGIWPGWDEIWKFDEGPAGAGHKAHSPIDALLNPRTRVAGWRVEEAQCQAPSSLYPPQRREY